MFRFSYETRLRMFHQFLTQCNGLSIFFDQSPQRLMYHGSGAQSVNIMVRAVIAHAESGETFELTPRISIPADHKSLGLLGSLCLKELGIRDFCRRDGRWRYILVTST